MAAAARSLTCEACPDPTADAEPPDGGAPNGSILIEECPPGVCSSGSAYVHASFFTDAHTGPPGLGFDGCTVTAAGACAYYACPSLMEEMGVRAGTLEVSGVWPTPTMVEPSCYSNFYPDEGFSPGAFAEGQTLTVSASGATVPAFGPQSIVAPGLALLTTPAISPDAGATSISTSADLPIAWTGGQAGDTMLLEIAGLDSSASTYSYMSCSWDAAAGQGTIPAAVLKPFAGTNQKVSYGQYGRDHVHLGPVHHLAHRDAEHRSPGQLPVTTPSTAAAATKRKRGARRGLLARRSPSLACCRHFTPSGQLACGGAALPGACVGAGAGAGLAGLTGVAGTGCGAVVGVAGAGAGATVPFTFFFLLRRRRGERTAPRSNLRLSHEKRGRKP